jgi:hypothetical protein
MQSQYPVVEAVLIGTSPICNSSVAGYYPGAFRSARQERRIKSSGASPTLDKQLEKHWKGGVSTPP